jgi:hypothetical protein
VLHVGVDQPAIDLTFLGMPGCSLLTTPVASLPMLPCLNGGSTSLGGIPVSPSILGGLVATQGIAFAPGINPLGLTSSNAVDNIIGY